MEWYRIFFKKQTPEALKHKVAELTEFELSESHKILLNTENIVEELLQHISDQKQIIIQYEEELRSLRYNHHLDAENKKITEEGSKLVS